MHASLAIYDVSSGRNRLRELFAAVPGLRDSLLGKRAKRFEEAYHQMLLRRLNSGSIMRSEPPLSVVDMLADHCSDEDDADNAVGGDCGDVVADGGAGDTLLLGRKISVDTSGSGAATVATDVLLSPLESVTTGALSTGHFQVRISYVEDLITCCEPVMNKDPENVWLACFGPSVPIMRSTSRSEELPPPPMVTNSLGLPIVKNASSLIHFSLLQDPLYADDEKEREIRDQMSLLGVFRAYNKENYNLNPVLISDNDYNTYYGGISNGLLWPAFHNLPEYISSDYDQPDILKAHWHAYVRVNYQFAINAVRNSRPQDFLWIHDYHLLLTGMIVHSLDPDLEVGFFLHTPFQPPATFFTKYKLVAEAVLRGILRFTKVGFQTHRDRATFINFVTEHMTTAKMFHDAPNDRYSISHEGFTSSLGVFPVSIKNEEFVNLSKDPNVVRKAREIRNNLMLNRTGKLFFSVERFDYTKGIKEKLIAYDRFLESHPERRGKDVLLQVAVINRRGIDSYREYQDDAIAFATQINDKHKLADDPDWKPVIFQTDGVARPVLVSHYLAMDVGVVTPIKDGMNLVAKEMLIANPDASLILSTGAGTEQQFNDSGFYSDEQRCYHRVDDVRNADEFANAFFEAAIESVESVRENSGRIREFLVANDIEKWSGAFLDPSWTHQVIQRMDISTLQDFHNFMFQTRDIRRHIADTVLRGFAIRQHFAMSLRNAKLSLEAACHDNDHHLLMVKIDQNSDRLARLNVADEIKQLQIDLDFLNFVQSDDYDNLEQFLHHLAKYHPTDAGDFYSQVEIASSLIISGDHYQYFFTDRDGTLKSYACSYPSSIQPAYSAVIQGTFAHRCAQYAAILTSAPLLNIGLLDVFVLPDGYFSYGASIGREWYVNATKKFKDSSISKTDHLLLDLVSSRIERLFDQNQFQQFKWIGSGLQKHYGHITVARQDCYGSIDELKSLQWYEYILLL
ncbi:unnamed protein product [Soboliphyme baturini]|uniref:alpha,alpha-trehalose-phosphate synthase (UDP-forming) n=1 Tax=Soboliphyme baturini TaxID=241478 RepID=A0A183J4X7_9BILA|nr:unnamed protein product [Soboliphyme baturini]